MSPAKSRTRTPTADIRAGLLAAGRRILERDGEARLTVRAVAAEAGVAPMGVYNHFDGKDGLINALVTDGFVEFARGIGTTDDDPADRLRNSGHKYREFALANPVLYGLMFDTDCEPDHEAATDAFAVLADIVRFGQAGGVIMAGDAEQIAMQAWSCVHGAVALELASAHPPQMDPAQNYDRVLTLIARGIAPQPR
ncbi:TetR/AcrR family transcriptional regulator [Gordonia sp. ABSL1-1]|uniref:TetR/AcrR family transcriptional regulator n=1 Tax=Gordonia sp. ABSL1-1 TaxID=3053923 RepID=UPI0025722CE5|nr:TetR/AcrR family transcriptional regulator [Gordonia sp. ABSL1-1]MDL9938748.1 TetR/AcrR family transcriptional regulator [Gordonia sp. ABSL1-1]